MNQGAPTAIKRPMTPGTSVGWRVSAHLAPSLLRRRARAPHAPWRCSASGVPRLRLEFSAHAAAQSGVATTQQTSRPHMFELPPLEERPGQKDKERFRLHLSVARWESWEPFLPSALEDSPVNALREAVSRLRDAGAFADATGATYWAYHLARCGFFTAQGIASVVVSSALGVDTQKSISIRIAPGQANGGANIVFRLVNEAMSLFRQDLDCIREGKYLLPWDMSPSHRQNTPAFVLRKGFEYLREAYGVMGRKEKGAPTDIWLRSGGDMYPDYYMSTFHYQTDGWMSSSSASVYETATETLFIGRQDAMQRLALLALRDHMERKGLLGQTRGMRVLEVGAGTGRFMTFLRDNYPAMDVTVSDLSPFYLEEARKNNEHWVSKRGDEAARRGGLGVAEFVQAKAEDLPFGEETFDVVTCTYLLHEVPSDVRESFFKEAARVLKPGGLLLVTDSVQLGDRPDRDDKIGNFSKFNEPFYESFLREDFGALGEEAGLVPEFKCMGSVTKTLSFTKPSSA